MSQQLILGFQRLRINDTSKDGDQPLKKGNISVIANAEIYNYEAIKAKYGFKFESSSDCEIFLIYLRSLGALINSSMSWMVFLRLLYMT